MDFWTYVYMLQCYKHLYFTAYSCCRGFSSCLYVFSSGAIQRTKGVYFYLRPAALSAKGWSPKGRRGKEQHSTCESIGEFETETLGPLSNALTPWPRCSCSYTEICPRTDQPCGFEVGVHPVEGPGSRVCEGSWPLAGVLLYVVR